MTSDPCNASLWTRHVVTSNWDASRGGPYKADLDAFRKSKIRRCTGALSGKRKGDWTWKNGKMTSIQSKHYASQRSLLRCRVLMRSPHPIVIIHVRGGFRAPSSRPCRLANHTVTLKSRPAKLPDNASNYAQNMCGNSQIPKNIQHGSKTSAQRVIQSQC